MGWNAFFAAAILGAVLVPAAAAHRAPQVKLSLVPLPKSALGEAGKSLELGRDSGVISNQLAAGNSASGTPRSFEKLGRITGYDLVYGDPFTGAAGVTEIASGIEQYETAAAAKKGLAFWRTDDAKVATRIDQYGILMSLKVVRVPAVGTRRFGYGTTLTFPNAAPLTLVDEQFAEGKYVLHVGVAADTLSGASGLASKLVRALDRRLQLAGKGRLKGRPVKLLPPQGKGPPTGGPDLATLALTPADLTGNATVGDHNYVTDPAALSAYVLDMNPAGQYHDLTQEIEWYSTANEATILATLAQATSADELGFLLGEVPIVTKVDLTSLGDNAQGDILEFPQSGIDVVAVGLSRGQASDVALASSTTPLQASDVQSLAQAMATHLDAGVPSAG